MMIMRYKYEDGDTQDVPVSEHSMRVNHSRDYCVKDRTLLTPKKQGKLISVTLLDGKRVLATRQFIIPIEIHTSDALELTWILAVD